jgi:hypothetical protein
VFHAASSLCDPDERALTLAESQQGRSGSSWNSRIEIADALLRERERYFHLFFRSIDHRPSLPGSPILSQRVFWVYGREGWPILLLTRPIDRICLRWPARLHTRAKLDNVAGTDHMVKSIWSSPGPLAVRATMNCLHGLHAIGSSLGQLRRNETCHGPGCARRHRRTGEHLVFLVINLASTSSVS